MEHKKYRFIMGVLAVILSGLSFLTSFAACILYVIFKDPWAKVLFFPLLFSAAALTVLSGIFSSINMGSKLGIAGLLITAGAAACLIVAFTQI